MKDVLRSISAASLLFVAACDDAKEADAKSAAAAGSDKTAAGADEAAPKSPEAEQPAAEKRACELVTEAAVSEIVGEKVTYDVQGRGECKLETPESTSPITVTINVSDGADEYELYKGMPNASDLAGIGDKAVWADNVQTAVALEGARTVKVTVHTLREGYDRKGKTQAVLAKVVEGM